MYIISLQRYSVYIRWVVNVPRVNNSKKNCLSIFPMNNANGQYSIQSSIFTSRLGPGCLIHPPMRQRWKNKFQDGGNGCLGILMFISCGDYIWDLIFNSIFLSENHLPLYIKRTEGYMTSVKTLKRQLAYLVCSSSTYRKIKLQCHDPCHMEGNQVNISIFWLYLLAII